VNGLRIWRCLGCGTAAFPRRAWCPACGSRDWAPEVARRGRIAETTVVRRAVGVDDLDPVRLATVALDDGPTVIAGVADGAEPGDAVFVEERDGAPVAMREAPS
jgi:uncharacterized protein